MKQLWAGIKPVLLGAIGGGIVGVASGYSSMTPSDKTQTMGNSPVWGSGFSCTPSKVFLYSNEDSPVLPFRFTLWAIAKWNGKWYH